MDLILQLKKSTPSAWFTVSSGLLVVSTKSLTEKPSTNSFTTKDSQSPTRPQKLTLASITSSDLPPRMKLNGPSVPQKSGSHQRVSSSPGSSFQPWIPWEPRSWSISSLPTPNLLSSLKLLYFLVKPVPRRPLLSFSTPRIIRTRLSREWISHRPLRHSISTRPFPKLLHRSLLVKLTFQRTTKTWFFLLMISTCQLSMNGEIKLHLRSSDNWLRMEDSTCSKD